MTGRVLLDVLTAFGVAAVVAFVALWGITHAWRNLFGEDGEQGK